MRILEKTQPKTNTKLCVIISLMWQLLAKSLQPVVTGIVPYQSWSLTCEKPVLWKESMYSCGVFSSQAELELPLVCEVKAFTAAAVVYQWNVVPLITALKVLYKKGWSPCAHLTDQHYSVSKKKFSDLCKIKSQTCPGTRVWSLMCTACS